MRNQYSSVCDSSPGVAVLLLNNMLKLLEIMKALRTPGTGCPWDLEQDFQSIVPYTLEEAHEVAEAIEHNDMPSLKSELGDLLFQVVFLARLAEEEGLFDFDDVAGSVNAKMIRRHPHVFGTQKSELSSEDIKGQWERIKEQEKENGRDSILDGIPVTLPALTRAVKLQNKAAHVGFDWPSLAPVFDKMREELAELEHEIDSGHDKDRVEDEFGDVLFVMANVGRHLKLDPEQALRKANNKFVRRFRVIEELLEQQGKTPRESGLQEMEDYWEIAKQREKGK